VTHDLLSGRHNLTKATHPWRSPERDSLASANDLTLPS
jgi:hypothetical protein